MKINIYNNSFLSVKSNLYGVGLFPFSDTAASMLFNMQIGRTSLNEKFEDYMNLHREENYVDNGANSNMREYKPERTSDNEKNYISSPQSLTPVQPHTYEPEKKESNVEASVSSTPDRKEGDNVTNSSPIDDNTKKEKDIKNSKGEKENKEENDIKKQNSKISKKNTNTSTSYKVNTNKNKTISHLSQKQKKDIKDSKNNITRTEENSDKEKMSGEDEQISYKTKNAADKTKMPIKKTSVKHAPDTKGNILNSASVAQPGTKKTAATKSHTLIHKENADKASDTTTNETIQVQKGFSEMLSSKDNANPLSPLKHISDIKIKNLQISTSNSGNSENNSEKSPVDLLKQLSAKASTDIINKTGTNSQHNILSRRILVTKGNFRGNEQNFSADSQYSDKTEEDAKNGSFLLGKDAESKLLKFSGKENSVKIVKNLSNVTQHHKGQLKTTAKQSNLTMHSSHKTDSTGAAATGKASVSPMMNSDNLQRLMDIRDIIAKMQMLLKNSGDIRKNFMSMDLESKNFGHINMSMDQKGETINIALQVSSENTKDSLMNYKQDILENLRNMGYKHISMDINANDNKGNENRKQQFENKQSNENPENVKLAGNDTLDMSRILSDFRIVT